MSRLKLDKKQLLIKCKSKADNIPTIDAIHAKILVISGHGSSIHPIITTRIPNNIDIIFTAHASDYSQNNIELENIIIREDYNFLNNLFLNECIPNRYTFEDKHRVNNTTIDNIRELTPTFTNDFEYYDDYDYFRYNSGSLVKDYLINLYDPIITSDENDMNIEIMKVGVYDTSNKNNFYKIYKNGVEYLGTSPDNQYKIDTLGDKEYIYNLDNLKYNDYILKTKICKVDNPSIICTSDVIEEEYDYIEDNSIDLVYNRNMLFKNYYKSKIGNLIKGLEKIRLSKLLQDLSKLYPNNKLLVFILTCRE